MTMQIRALLANESLHAKQTHPLEKHDNKLTRKQRKLPQ